MIAEEDGRAVGFAQCQLRHDYVEGCETSPVGYLEGVFVREEYRRRGIATELVRAGEAWARSLGMTRADIAAFLGTDGSLTVVEQRTYQSKGSYSGILWDVQQGSYQGREVRASVAEVSVVTDGQRTTLQEGREGAPGT